MEYSENLWESLSDDVIERLCSSVTLDSRLSYPDIRERVLQDLHHFLIALADMVEDTEEAL